LTNRAEQYYVLKLGEGEEGEEEIAFLDLGKDEELEPARGDGSLHNPQRTGAAGGPQQAPRSPDGSPVSHKGLLEAVERVMPTSVFVDGKRVAGSAFVRMLREELGIPIRMPRLIRWLQV